MNLGIKGSVCCVFVLVCCFWLVDLQSVHSEQQHDNDTSTMTVLDKVRVFGPHNQNSSNRFKDRDLDNVFTIVLSLLWGDNVDSELSFQQSGSAVTLAIQDFYRKGGISEEFNYDIVFVHDGCQPNVAIPNILELYPHGIDVILGMACSEITTVAGYYLSYHDIPLISHGSNDPAIDDKHVYNTVVRMSLGYKAIGTAFLHLFHEYSWQKVGIMSGRSGLCQQAAEYTVQAFKTSGDIEITEWAEFDEDEVDDELFLAELHHLKERARIIIVCLESTKMVRFFEEADREGMVTSEYVYFTIEPSVGERLLRPWYSDNLTTEQLKHRQSLFRYMKTITTPEFNSEADVKMQEKLWLQNQEPPFNWNLTNTNPVRTGRILTLYDTAMSWLICINQSLFDGTNPRSGRNIWEKSSKLSFRGATGDVVMDGAADRITTYAIWQYVDGHEHYTHIADVIPNNPPNKRLRILDGKSLHWGTIDGKPPRDTPACGFVNELCPPAKLDYNVILISSFAVLCVLILTSYLIFLVIRKRKYDEDMKRMLWKIKYSDIDFHGGTSRNNVHGSTTMRNSVKSMQSVAMAGGAQRTISIGKFKGITVAIKKVKKSQEFTIPKTLLVELKEVKDLSHENLNLFLGACIELPHVYIVSPYCSRGSLQDVLENDDIKLGKTFQESFVSDLANGMKYIHDSEIESHGQLCSKCCLVDSRWVLKIANVGLERLRQPECSFDEDVSKSRDMLWCAPELLRMTDRPYRGTQKGDVYSYAIILQEIVFRSHPYFMIDLEPKDIIAKVKEGTVPPFRPKLDGVSVKEETPGVIDLMIQCWNETASQRPSFGEIKKAIIKINNGKKINILDNMLDKLEKYANNLESIVEQRTEALLQEKKKTDDLLYRMLPSPVAEKLKLGLCVAPELYEEATVYFSDIVGFTSLSSMSTPMQVVVLLNDLYSCFDDIIARKDVYKVETIGDAYMCVSGIPERNGHRHAAEIANMALELRNAVSHFTIRHMRETPLRIRIGIHTGPCATGVVGLTMPRYCLFGDTVNTASRMETNSVAMKIHLSEAAHQAITTIGGYVTTCRGETEIKGKGIITTYWLEGKVSTSAK